MSEQGSVKPLPAPGTNAMHERIKKALEARNYELQGELGRGGMGVVYLAQHKKLGRRVAIKTLAPDRQAKENSIARFQREAKTFAQIRHDNIATLFEFEDSGPIQYLALEYIDGTDLERERRRGKKWKATEVARMIASVADALDHTHKKGILHRDIKPGNILIERNTNRIVLTDFGLAKGEGDDTLTASGFAVGTPAYMAPEQITDSFGAKPDGRADLFSLGTVAYEMLTGKHPFLAADDLNTMRNIVNQKAMPLRELDPSVPEDIAQIFEMMLAKNPKDRQPDAATVAKQLIDACERKPASTGPIAAPPPAADPKSAARPAADPKSAPRAPEPAPAPPPPPAPAGMSKDQLVKILAIVIPATIVVTAILVVVLMKLLG